MDMGAPTLLERYVALASERGRMRAVDVAEILGVPEAALLAARAAAGGDGAGMGPVRRLGLEAAGFARLFAGLPAIGAAMALSRNDACVSEIHGDYAPAEIEGTLGQVVGPVDLRLFLSHWVHGYAVTDLGETVRRSIQVFDASGTAVHKIHATGATDLAAFEALVDRLAAPAAPVPDFAPVDPPAADRPDDEIDAAALRSDWQGLEHSHAFHALLRRHRVGRLQALRLAGAPFARPASSDAADRLLGALAGSGITVMVFVSNRGCVQIFSGRVERVAPMGPWINVLDPGFNLHLRRDRIAASWVVRKPSATHGDVTSVEFYDAVGALVLQVFGHRPPGGRERPDWHALAESLAEDAS